MEWDSECINKDSKSKKNKYQVNIKKHNTKIIRSDIEIPNHEN